MCQELDVAALVGRHGDAVRILPARRRVDDLLDRTVVAGWITSTPPLEDAAHDVDGGVMAVEQRRGGDEADAASQGRQSRRLWRAWWRY